ncbi:MAG: hypothetical protein M1821_007784 [Bathelium mastoideum]|nr:MAG: hypothetical protein M1821_007784 [Bathelium mastoideum]
MASSLHSPNHRLISAQVIGALERLEEAHEQLTFQRFNDPPPPYSRETTQLATPEEHIANDQSFQQYLRNKALRRSTPREQFAAQTRREEERIVRYNSEKSRNCKHAPSFNQTMNLQENAENNVRAGWVEQGIWMEEWGPAWPSGAKPSDNTWRSANPKGPRVTDQWAHEKAARIPQCEGSRPDRS